MADEIFLHGAEDFAAAWAALLPSGSAWDKNPDSVLSAFLLGMSSIWANPVDASIYEFLTTECDPRATLLMLPDWERAYGLPDLCNDESQTLASRHQALVAKIIALGAQSRKYFIDLAASIGYTVLITEYSPFMCGISRCGDTRSLAPESSVQAGDYRWQIGPPEIRFQWMVHVFGVKLIWFRCGADGGQCGIDPMVLIAFATDLECLFRRYKPAHTLIVFNYLNAVSSWGEWVWFRCGGGGGHCGVDHMFEVITHNI